VLWNVNPLARLTYTVTITQTRWSVGSLFILGSCMETPYLESCSRGRTRRICWL